MMEVLVQNEASLPGVEEMEVPNQNQASLTGIEAPPGMVSIPAQEMWHPDKTPDIRIEGEGALRTFALPHDAQRLQYMIAAPPGSERPIKARIELWLGPERVVHTMIYDCMSGAKYPLWVTLQFKKGVAPVLKVSTDSSQEFPLIAGVFIPNKEESEKLGKLKKDMFYSAPLKQKVQGGSIAPGGKPAGGSIRYFPVDPSWEKTQIMLWSTDVGKKSFNTDLEFLQGPNTPKLHMSLKCGGSTQPFHAVLGTPDGGGIIRCNSNKFIEDGKFEIAVAPYQLIEKPVAPVQLGGD